MAQQQEIELLEREPVEDKVVEKILEETDVEEAAKTGSS
jgi:hypothetical protein